MKIDKFAHIKIIFILILSFAIYSCVPKPPKLSGYGRSDYHLDHSGLTNCRECHYPRSYPSNHKTIGATDQCSKCHGTLNWDIHKGAVSCSLCHEDNSNQTTNTNRPASANYSVDHDSRFNGIAHYTRAKLSGETYSQVDCINCHVIGSWAFNHRRHNGATLSFCLPCHYQKGVNAHGSSSSKFGTYNYNNGQYGACAQCHATDFNGGD